MILYHAPGACGPAPHILMHEVGIKHDARRGELRKKKLADGSEFLKVDPKGAVLEALG